MGEGTCFRPTGGCIPPAPHPPPGESRRSYIPPPPPSGPCVMRAVFGVTNVRIQSFFFAGCRRCGAGMGTPQVQEVTPCNKHQWDDDRKLILSFPSNSFDRQTCRARRHNNDTPSGGKESYNMCDTVPLSLQTRTEFLLFCTVLCLKNLVLN